MWKCKTCQDTHRVFDFQCHKQQIEKERIKRVMKHRSLYHVMRAERTQSDDVKDVHRDIYQSEITDKQ